jgi:hypothetical protein
MSRLFAIAAACTLGLALGACSSTQDVLEPTALLSPSTPVSAEPAAAQEQAATPQQAAPVAAPQVAALPQAMRVHFAPVIGATGEASSPLSARLDQRARERGLTLVSSADATTTHVMRGYFSAITDNGTTTVIYVWDVVDPAGNRVHRIQGQQQAGASGEGWAAVDAATMEAIADRTVSDLANWAGSRRG